MTAYGAYDLEAEPATKRRGTEAAAVLAAVKEDIRQTLRTAWVDPALEAAATSPAFFTAAWSAVRPNIGRSFLLLAKALRTEAADWTRARLTVPDLRLELRGELSDEEIHRLEESARAAHLAAAKIQIVVHALYQAARRERIVGTGIEEPPIRRGIPDWQRWMSFQPSPEVARNLIEEARSRLGGAGPPIPLRLMARWPRALSVFWDAMSSQVQSDGWASAEFRLRRIVLAGMSTLPHPVELQWTALRGRGLTEEERFRLVGVLCTHDGAMPGQTLAAAFAWMAFGAPEIGLEG